MAFGVFKVEEERHTANDECIVSESLRAINHGAYNTSYNNDEASLGLAVTMQRLHGPLNK